VLVVEDGPTPQVKLLDFGIAKVLQPAGGQEGLTLAGQRLGTAYAMAPEQLRGGPITPNTDVYALGVLLFQLLTGRYPFQSKDRMELERLHLEAPPPRPSACAPVSLAVDAVVLRCLEKEAERRFPHTAAFLTALRQAVDTQGLAASDGRACQALAVHAEVELAEGTHDDELFHAALADVLDRLERELRQLGFLLALQVGTAQLGVRLLEPAHPLLSPEAHALREALERMDHTVREQTRRLGVPLHLCAHVGMVEVRGDGEGLEVLGGPLTELSTWVIHAPEGLHVSPSAAQILEFGA
jgi:hypothetical protein